MANDVANGTVSHTPKLHCANGFGVFALGFLNRVRKFDSCRGHPLHHIAGRDIERQRGADTAGPPVSPMRYFTFVASAVNELSAGRASRMPTIVAVAWKVTLPTAASSSVKT
jgi:hypothetical protein